jgi:hypothetical protein
MRIEGEVCAVYARVVDSEEVWRVTSRAKMGG